MRLLAGLIRTSPLWGSILDQEGYPWQAIRSPDLVDVERYSVIIAGKISGSPWEEVLKLYVRKGGAAIVDQDVMARWDGGRQRWEKYSYLLPAEDSWLRGNRVIDIAGKGLVLESGGTLRTDGGADVLPVRPFGGGAVGSFPFDLVRYAGDVRSSRRLFPSPVKPYPSERVSRVPKGELRLMVRGVLKALHQLRGLHYIHVRFFPGIASNVFGLRVDTDYSNRDEVEDLYSVIREKNMPASWFLHVKAHLGWIRDFVGMKDQEIGVHCYAHREYGSSGLRRRDVAKARDLLLAAGLEPGGFAAPYGIWKDKLAADLEKIGFRYSSEFGYDYDNLPSFPWVRGGFSKVLQLPVHPISMGNLALAGYGEREMIDYYVAVIDRKLSVHEPIFIYIHPADDHVEVLREVLDRINEGPIMKLTLAEYVDWWYRRKAVLGRIDISIESGWIRCLVRGDGRSDRLSISITDPGGNVSLARLEERIGLEDLIWRSEPGPTADVADMRSLLGDRRRKLLEDIRTYFWRRRG